MNPTPPDLIIAGVLAFAAFVVCLLAFLAGTA
jgi:hypothetical protein